MKILEKRICVYMPNLKENKYKHYEISESIENIIRLDEKLKTIRKLKENQISIIGMYNIFYEISQNSSLQKTAKVINKDIRSIKQKIEIMESKNVKELSKNERYKCQNCFKNVQRVKEIHFTSLYNHLANYRLSRMFFWNLKIREKWELFKEFWNEELNKYIKYKNAKNLSLKVTKKSVKYLVNKYKLLNPSGFIPSISIIYKKIGDGKFFLNFDHIIRKSEGKYVKKVKKSTKSVTLTHAIDISQRPEYINNRSEFGHYELDTVIGKINDKKCLVTLIERKTRKAYATISFKKSKNVTMALKYMIKKYNLNIKSLTVDNGKENVLLHKVIGSNKLYKCAPYCSWQKGSIENMHRLIRYYIPKGRTIDKYSQTEIEYMMQNINEYRDIISDKLR
ncbi:IS30 family transposase [Mycoplasmopsis cynos]|uniref:IS30 family transposase n=1 Tax=Mycoplasmopsis cynos TaxID=171284 RepID=UPI002AFE7842|nr:IS30 family transposase [Mycoplasmopsis cynos]WQQ16720.1 IS30 family transposase [Mycoplasmopsis cynos]WQQ17013.1 IS30 family transposase [Mycoplasmopsis cynos]